MGKNKADLILEIMDLLSDASIDMIYAVRNVISRMVNINELGGKDK